MNKGPEHPKVSFLVARQTLDKVTAFAEAENMKLSEVFRLVIDAGLEVFASERLRTANDLRAGGGCNAIEQAIKWEKKAELIPPTPRGAPTPPTRGKFPRPTGGHHGRTTEQE